MRQPKTETKLSEVWGGAVSQRRRTLGLSQADLADLCEVTQQTISKIEAGLMIPHDNLKLALANRMGMEPGELFEWPTRTFLFGEAVA